MKKRLVVIVLALVMLLSLATPVMAATRSDIVDSLRTLANQRVGARTQINSAIRWLNTAEGRDAIAGNESAILSNINAAIDAGLDANGNVIPLPNLLEDAGRLSTIVNSLTTGARLAGITITVDLAAINDGMNATQVMRLFQITLPSGQTAAADVIRQTGYEADYSILLLVATLILAMLTVATIFSVRLRLRSDGAK